MAVVSVSGDEQYDYNRVLHTFIDLFKQQRQPQQAEMLIPAWALERLLALPEEARKGILQEIDWLATNHGLLTPTKFIVQATSLTPDDGAE